MGYIGNSYAQQAIQPATDFFNGNGVTTAFTLSRPLQSVYPLTVVVNNVQQNPANAFSVTGNTINFSGAPSTGTNNIYVSYNSISAQTLTQPSQGTVNTAQLGVVSNINSANSNMTLQTNGTTALTISSSTQAVTFSSSATFGGNIIPSAGSVYNLGSSSTRWANVFTSDLNLSNELLKHGNDIDGTKGNWTIQEGLDALYIINNITNKRYKIMLEEV